MHVAADPHIGTQYRELETHFASWEEIKDCIDQNIDVFENYRQSGHPGGSRSKVHMLVALTLGGFMRWDIRRPEHRFGDRFIRSPGTPCRLSIRCWRSTTRRCRRGTSAHTTRDTW